MQKCLLLVLFLLPVCGYSADRYALVIGNSNYASDLLLNPANDAADMAVQLQQLGYKVHGGAPHLDLDRLGIERTVRAFANQLPSKAHALFYYAGHGMTSGSDNYLIPINHQLEDLEALPDRAVSLRSVINRLKNANPDGVNIALIDACRDSPLKKSYRSLRQGLNRLNDLPRGVFIGYAADVGQVAEDGLGRNGTYTAQLLHVMRNHPDEIIEIAHKKVAARVFDITSGAQFPVSENKVYGNWCFGPCAKPLDTTVPVVQPAPVARTASTGTSPPLSTTGIGSAETTGRGNLLWVGLGIVAAALILSSSGGSDSSPQTNFSLTVEPPQ